MRCKIEQLPLISAIYYSLLQSGYEYYSLERDQHFNSKIKNYIGTDIVPSFFSYVKQSTCDVYPYWPRAYILETATFYLNEDLSAFGDFDSFQRLILSTDVISIEEKNMLLWTWLTGFPKALKSVINSVAFSRYLKWEKEWLWTQSNSYRDELHLLENLLGEAQKKYPSSRQNMRIVLCPIKCVYSSDYHIFGDSLIFTSGDLRMDSIIHEFMHTIVHPIIEQEVVIPSRTQYPGIDSSYYIDQTEKGCKNAFEEYVVRTLTDRIIKQKKLPDITELIAQLE